MNATPDDLDKRLLYILYYGLTEIRNLALAAENDQIADLADALELLPRYVGKATDEDMDLIRFALEKYQARFPVRAFDYIGHLEEFVPPERY